MFRPRYVVQKAPGVGGPPIPEDEPVIVIRAQDLLARMVVSCYLTEYSRLSAADPVVIAELEGHAAALRLWQDRNSDRMKFADR